MINETKKIADIVATEMREMRTLMERRFGELTVRQEKFEERIFGELNVRMEKIEERMIGELTVRLDKFDEQILELKKCIESSWDQDKGEKSIEAAMNPSSNSHKNSSMHQEQVKQRREPILATYSRKRNKKKDVVSLTEDVGIDAPIVGYVPTEEATIDVIKDNTVRSSIVDVVPIEEDMTAEDNNNVSIVDGVSTEETEMNMELAVGGEFCVTGYHREVPLAVLMGEEETTHNFINESLADKLGCETVPIQPQTVRSDLGEMVTSRLCNNFQLSLEGIVFKLKVYLVPLPSKHDMILGGEWLGGLQKIIINYDGIELCLLDGEKKFIPFKKSIRGRRRNRF